jgi:hypothetical protein
MHPRKCCLQFLCVLHSKGISCPTKLFLLNTELVQKTRKFLETGLECICVCEIISNL